MRLKINPFAKRKLEVFWVFSATDLFLMAGPGIILPVVGQMMLGVPMYVGVLLITTPLMIYFFRYKVGKRIGYASKLFGYRGRFKKWRSSLSYKGTAKSFSYRCPGYDKLSRR